MTTTKTTTTTAADEMTADEIGEDVQTFHIEHMDECEYCTWWYCEHYPCGC